MTEHVKRLTLVFEDKRCHESCAFAGVVDERVVWCRLFDEKIRGGRRDWLCLNAEKTVTSQPAPTDAPQDAPSERFESKTGWRVDIYRDHAELYVMGALVHDTRTDGPLPAVITNPLSRCETGSDCNKIDLEIETNDWHPDNVKTSPKEWLRCAREMLASREPQGDPKRFPHNEPGVDNAPRCQYPGCSARSLQHGSDWRGNTYYHGCNRHYALLGVKVVSEAPSRGESGHPSGSREADK